MSDFASNNLGLILFPLLETELKAKELKRVLEIGCGTGELTNRIGNYSESVLGIDVSERVIAQAVREKTMSNIAFQVADFNTFDENGEKYDLIISSFVFHHFPLVSSLEKAVSMLVPGGRLIILDMYGLREKSFGKYVFNQAITENIRYFSGTIQIIKSIGFLRTLDFLRARIAFYIDRDGRAHTKQDLNMGLPPTIEEWKEAFDAFAPSGIHQQLIGPVFIYIYIRE